MGKLLLIGLAAFALAAVPSFAGSKSDIEKLERDFNAAYAVNDFDKYFGFYADDAVLWFPEGRTDIPAYKKMWGEFLQSGAAILVGDVSDLHIRLSPRGDVAVASYLLRLKTREADKTVTDESFQETDVWFRTSAGWKITHVHYSAAPRAVQK